MSKTVWIDFHSLAERCRKSNKCDGKIKYAPSTDIIPKIEYYQKDKQEKIIKK